jgi:hypothetical protein
MRNVFRRFAGVTGVLVLASVVVFGGCNNPTPVEPVDQTSIIYTEETPCPTLDLICNTIANEIESLCPRAFPYRNWGEENSCVKTLTAQLIDSYKDCLTGEQLSEVRDCVQHELALRAAEGSRDEDPCQL